MQLSRPAVRRAALLLTIAAAIATAATAQAPNRWVQPYSDVPTYWEQIQPDSASLPSVLRGPQIRSVAIINRTPRTGDLVASVVGYNFLLGESGLALGTSVTDLVEVRFVGADNAGVSLEMRQGARSFALSRQLSQCVKDGAEVAFHRLDVRWHVVANCNRFIEFGGWQQLRFSHRASYLTPRDLPLEFVYDTANQSLIVSVRSR